MAASSIEARAELVAKREIAAALGVTERTIERLVKRGMPVHLLRNGRPRFDVRQCRDWYLQPVELRRFRRATCSACGYRMHVEERFTSVPLPALCPRCGDGSLRVHGASHMSAAAQSYPLARRVLAADIEGRKRKRVLAVIAAYEDEGHAPSVREIAVRAKLVRSDGRPAIHLALAVLRRLEADGLLRVTWAQPGRARNRYEVLLDPASPS